jgi:hypothetical protein
MTTKHIARGVALAAILVMSTAAAEAQEHRWHDFYGRDFRYFGPHELAIWRGGRWIHDWHDGRFGWWWWTDGYWYYYPQPIYPYPTYVPPPVVVTAPAAPPAPAPNSPTWYFCDNPNGYYPYVQTCLTPWRAVAPTPLGQAPGQSAPPPTAQSEAPPPSAPPGPPESLPTITPPPPPAPPPGTVVR